jgi:hypothetical protein
MTYGGQGRAPFRLHDGTPVCFELAEWDRTAGEGVHLSARDAGGRVVGRASYRRVYGPRAELSVSNDDAFWHRGLPALLIGSLREHAAAAGISTFLLRARASEVRLLALLSGDFAARCSRDGDLVDVELACREGTSLAADRLASSKPRQRRAHIAAEHE